MTSLTATAAHPPAKLEAAGGGGGVACARTAGAPDPEAPAAAATHLERLVHELQPCVLRPFCFFVSWQVRARRWSAPRRTRG